MVVLVLPSSLGDNHLFFLLSDLLGKETSLSPFSTFLPGVLPATRRELTRAGVKWVESCRGLPVCGYPFGAVRRATTLPFAGGVCLETVVLASFVGGPLAQTLHAVSPYGYTLVPVLLRLSLELAFATTVEGGNTTLVSRIYIRGNSP